MKAFVILYEFCYHSCEMMAKEVGQGNSPSWVDARNLLCGWGDVVGVSV